MKHFLWLTILLPSITLAASLFDVDDNFPESTRKSKGLTVNVPVSKYYPTNTNSDLYKVLKQAQILTSNISFIKNGDGIPYKQHNGWNNKKNDDTTNLKRGIDCSRVIWFAFTRAGVPYNPQNRYLDTSIMWRENSNMKHYFNRCSVDNLQLGDVLIYRGYNSKGKIVGHTVMVLDPKKKLAWGSHGWDKSRHKDTGVEVQKVVSRNGWRSWDKRSMKLKACWRHKNFSKNPIISSPSKPIHNSQHLTNSDLVDKTRYELWLMRNEMFARKGYRFKSRKLATHFQQQFWYQPTNNDSSSIFYNQFSNLERYNVKFLYQYEKNKIFTKPVNNQQSLQYDYPETAIRRLTYTDIVGKSKRELRIMRNEIYAQHGYRFGKSDLRNYFNKKSWYKSSTTNGTYLYNSKFTSIERYNVKFIRKYEL